MSTKRAKRSETLAGESKGLNKTSYELYQADIKRFPQLDPAVTDELIRRLRQMPEEDRAGEAGEALRQEIVQGNQNFSIWLARKTVRAGRGSYDDSREARHDQMLDIIGLANIGLLEATLTYDPDFQTSSGQPGKRFVWWAMDSHIKPKILQAQNKSRRPYTISADVELKLSHMRQARMRIEKRTKQMPTSIAEVAKEMNAMLRERRKNREEESNSTFATAVHTYTVDELKSLEKLEASAYSVSTDAPLSAEAGAGTIGETIADEASDPDEREFFKEGPGFAVATEQLSIRDQIAYRLLYQADEDGVVMAPSAVQHVIGQHTNTIDARMKAARESVVGGEIRQTKKKGNVEVEFTVTDELIHERMKAVRNPEARPLPKRGRVHRNF